MAASLFLAITYHICPQIVLENKEYVAKRFYRMEKIHPMEEDNATLWTMTENRTALAQEIILLKTGGALLKRFFDLCTGLNVSVFRGKQYFVATL